jgi:hypothetical protein
MDNTHQPNPSQRTQTPKTSTNPDLASPTPTQVVPLMGGKDLLQLQRVVGNRAAQAILQRAGGKLDPHTAVPTIDSMSEARMEQVLGFEALQNKEMESRVKQQLIAAPDQYKLGMLALINDDAFWQPLVDAALAAKLKELGDVPQFQVFVTDAATLRGTIRGAINGITAYDPDGLKTSLRAGVAKGATFGAMSMLVISFVTSSNNKILADKVAARYGAPDKRSEADYVEEGEAVNKANVAEGFMEFRKTNSVDQVDLTKAEKAELSTALLEMPIVQWMMNKKRKDTDTQMTTSGGETVDLVVADWKGGDTLADNAFFADYDTNTKKPVYTSEKIPKSSKSYDLVVTADNMLRRMVSPDLLKLYLPPKVYIVRSSKFRAYQSENVVHISTSDGQEILVHEMSHYIEDYAPSEMWHDIHTLMRARHQARADERLKKKPNDADANLLGHGEMGMKNEGRYRGEYAATGMYTSSAYGGGGSTEFTSMTTQFLAKPDTAKDLIQKDPVQAALVLKHLRPDEFAPIAAKFSKVLPHLTRKRR